MIQKAHDDKAKRNGRWGEKTNKQKKNILPAPQSSIYCLSEAVLWDSGVVQLYAVASQAVYCLIFISSLLQDYFPYVCFLLGFLFIHLMELRLIQWMKQNNVAFWSSGQSKVFTNRNIGLALRPEFESKLIQL